MPAIDDARFREVVGHFATGVVVVTGRGPSGPVGFTCQSFGSLSLDPLLVFFSARSDGYSWPQIRRTQDVAINILTSRQEALARVFGTSVPDKFDGVAWHAGAGGAPLLGDALATMEGRLESVTTHGDHDLAVVAVDHVELSDGGPLIYYRRGYGTFTS